MKKTVKYGLVWLLMVVASVVKADPYQEVKAMHCHQYQQMIQQVVIPRMNAGTPLNMNLQYWNGTQPLSNERNLKYLTQQLYQNPKKIKDYVNSDLFVTHCVDWVEL